MSNLTSNAPKFLEQSIYADGLTPTSVERLHRSARAAWGRAFESVVVEVRERVDADASSDGDLRMRFGVYFFSEPASVPAGMPVSERTQPTAPRRRASKRIKP